MAGGPPPPPSTISPAGRRPAASRYQPSRATSVSVQIVPVPIEPAAASIPVTRSTSSIGGLGRRVDRGRSSRAANVGPNSSEILPSASRSSWARSNVGPRGAEWPGGGPSTGGPSTGGPSTGGRGTGGGGGGGPGA